MSGMLSLAVVSCDHIAGKVSPLRARLHLAPCSLSMRNKMKEQESIAASNVKAVPSPTRLIMG